MKILEFIKKIYLSKIYHRILKVVLILTCIIILSKLPMFVTYALFMFIMVFILFILVYSFRRWNDNRVISNIMNGFNTITFGFKGRGKDLTTQISIYKTFHRRYKKQIKILYKENSQYYETRILDEKYLNYYMLLNYEDNFETWLRYKKILPMNYLSNIDYGYGSYIVDFKQFELSVKINNKMYYNDYIALINGTLKKVVKIEDFEGLNYYGSDSGILLPNTEDSELNKKYKTLPVMVALSRQLYDMNFNFNTQDLNRIWKKFREQQDYYIKAIGVFPGKNPIIKYIVSKIPYFKKRLFVKLITYEKYQSAVEGKLPISKTGLLSKNNMMYDTSPATLKEIYNAENGIIKERTVCIKYKDIKYDTRYFHLVMFGKKYREKK